LRQSRIEDVARRYLAGEPLPKLATQSRVNHSNLCKVLRERCGPLWVQRVRCRELGIDEEINTTVPELLPPETVRAIGRRRRVSAPLGRRGCAGVGVPFR
jgi:hypothetical protein